MKNFKFLTTTYYTKIMFILDMIRQDNKITQMKIATTIGTGDAIVNRYIGDLCNKKYVEKIGKNSRNMQYKLTKKGRRYLEELYLTYLFELMLIYRDAKKPLLSFAKSIYEKGIKSVLLYGAGEVINVAIEILEDANFKIIGIVDDSPQKQGKLIYDYSVIPSEEIPKQSFDAIIITSFSYRNAISKRIKNMNVNKPIIMFGIQQI